MPASECAMTFHWQNCGTRFPENRDRRTHPNLLAAIKSGPESNRHSGSENGTNYTKIGTGGHTQIKLSQPKADAILGSENDPDSGVRKRHQCWGRFTLYQDPYSNMDRPRNWCRSPTPESKSFSDTRIGACFQPQTRVRFWM